MTRQSVQLRIDEITGEIRLVYSMRKFKFLATSNFLLSAWKQM